MAQLRLDKWLTDTGRWSRKEAKELIRQGAVRVDGAVIKKADAKFDPQTCSLTVRGETVRWNRYCYLMLHKPGGVVTATKDNVDKTVLDLLPEEYRRMEVAPVGRLDKDTEGLLILTNHGDLAHRLLSPKYHVDKTYFAKTEGTVTEEDIRAFEAGIVLSDLQCMPAKLEIAGENACLVTIQEGKYHQVKRMLASRGKPVTYLKRLSMGEICLDSALKPGEFRLLDEREIAILTASAGL